MRALLIHSCAWNPNRLMDDLARHTKIAFDLATTTADGAALARETLYDLVIAAQDDPDDTSLLLIEALRANGATTPIIMLTGNCLPHLRVEGLRRGADDWINLPCDPRIIAARVNALSRRFRSGASDTIVIGNLTIDTRNQTVHAGHTAIPLTCREYSILEFLAQRTGVTITKEAFLNHIYGGRDEPELKIIDVFICKLRKKIADHNDGEHYVKTVWGRGYEMSSTRGDKTSKGQREAG